MNNLNPVNTIDCHIVPIRENSLSTVKRLNGMHIILMGAPGAGKGTLAQFLVRHDNFFQLSLGDILRKEIRECTPIGLECKQYVDAGKIVPLEIGFKLFKKHFDEALRNNKKVIIDGMVQKQEYVDLFDQTMKEHSLQQRVCFVYLRISQEAAISRVMSRIVCNSCGHVYSKMMDLSVCEDNACKGEVVERIDDVKQQTVATRVDRFFKGSSGVPPLTALIEKNYAARENYLEIDVEKFDLATLHKLYRSVFIQPKVLGIGYAAMDRIIPVDEEFLKDLQILKGDGQVVQWETFSKVIEKKGEVASGGSSATVMKGLARLGQNAAFLGKIGQDNMGHQFCDKLQALEVDPMLFQSTTPTTQIACLVTPDHQRTMLIFLGAGAELNEKNLEPQQFSGIKLLHIDGYSLWNDSLLVQAMQLAKKAGALVSFDLGIPDIVHQFKQTILELLPKYVDIVFGNDEEIEALTGLKMVEGLDVLKNLCPVAVAKVGKEGCWVASKDMKFHSPSIPPKIVVDTTGAGDNFAGGFLFGYLGRRSLEECAHYGNLVGSAAVEVQGAEIPESKWTELKSQIMLKQI